MQVPRSVGQPPRGDTCAPLLPRLAPPQALRLLPTAPLGWPCAAPERRRAQPPWLAAVHARDRAPPAARMRPRPRTAAECFRSPAPPSSIATLSQKRCTALVPPALAL